MPARGQIIVNCVNSQARFLSVFTDKPETSFVIIREFYGNGGTLFASNPCVLCLIALRFVPNDDAVCTKRAAVQVQNAMQLGTKRSADFVNTFQTLCCQTLAKRAEKRIFGREKVFIQDVAVFSVKISGDFC